MKRTLFTITVAVCAVLMVTLAFTPGAVAKPIY